MKTLLAALRRLGRRGEGRHAWAAPLVDDPVAFLLDATGDYVNVWGPGQELLYSNHTTVELALRPPKSARVERIVVGGRELERRSLPFAVGDATYLLEVVREVGR